MTLIDDLKPLILGPFVRSIAIWIEIVTFSLSLLSSFYLVSIVSFSVLGVLTITDIVLTVRTRKAHKVARLLNQPVLYPVPKLSIAMFDLVFGILFVVSWAFMIYYSVRAGSSSYYSSYVWGEYNTFGAFTMVGNLAIAHVHIFLGSVTIHMIRQQKSGLKAALRARAREQSRDNGSRTVELAVPGSSRV